MAVIESAFQARQMHDISLIFDKGGTANVDGVQFRQCIQSCQWVPSVSVATTIGGTPGSVFSDVSPATWTVNLKLLQDIEKAGSLVNYLLANAGKQVLLEQIPNKGAKISGVVILTPPALGGDMNAWLDATLTFGVVGVPVVSGTTA